MLEIGQMPLGYLEAPELLVKKFFLSAAWGNGRIELTAFVILYQVGQVGQAGVTHQEWSVPGYSGNEAVDTDLDSFA